MQLVKNGDILLAVTKQENMLEKFTKLGRALKNLLKYPRTSASMALQPKKKSASMLETLVYHLNIFSMRSNDVIKCYASNIFMSIADKP